MDKELIKRRFSKASASYQANATVQKNVALKLFALTSQFVKEYGRVLELGCGSGVLSRLLSSANPTKLLLNDISGQMGLHVEGLLGEDCTFVVGDAQRLEFEGEFDLIISSSLFQWFDEPQDFFGRVKTKLNKDGILAFSTFGQNNLKEVKNLTGIGLDTPTCKQLQVYLKEDFELLHVEEFEQKLYFDSPKDVLTHLKKTGVNGVSQARWTKSSLKNFCDKYERKFSEDKKVVLTYEPIIIIGKKR